MIIRHYGSSATPVPAHFERSLSTRPGDEAPQVDKLSP
jgi:hypothetical protein